MPVGSFYVLTVQCKLNPHCLIFVPLKLASKESLPKLADNREKVTLVEQLIAVGLF